MISLARLAASVSCCKIAITPITGTTICELLLAGLINRKVTLVTIVLHKLSQTGMGDVVVVAEFTEGIAAALQLTVWTDRSTTVCTSTHGRLATRHSNTAIAGHVFELA